ncbi:MAG: AtpZ/AtpI family protein [Planctomycetes bacterium]|nr:AtpZ/AtpI family protein [Planctomycetota bacterium]
MNASPTAQLRLHAGKPAPRPPRMPMGNGGADGDEDGDDRRTPAKPPVDLRSWARPYALLSSLVAGVLGATLIGIWLDRQQGSSPAWTLGLVLPVLAAGLWQLVRESKR